MTIQKQKQQAEYDAWYAKHKARSPMPVNANVYNTQTLRPLAKQVAMLTHPNPWLKIIAALLWIGLCILAFLVPQ